MFKFFFNLLFVVSSCFFFSTEARPLSFQKTDRNIGFFDGLAMKNGGPSSGGAGHSYMDAQPLGEIKNSGPSPGAGNKFADANTVGGIKNSGPSPGGAGHSFRNAGTLGGIKFTDITLGSIKPSGPSPRGRGHSSVNSQTLGGIKGSGCNPSNNGHIFTTGFQMLDGWNDSHLGQL